MVARRDALLGALAGAMSLPAWAQVSADPPSRGQLFETFLRKRAPVDTKGGAVPLAIPDLFKFPDDAKYEPTQNSTQRTPRPPSVFGVDISAWTDSSVPLGDMRLQSVGFVYAKASQGTSYRDKKFPAFWKTLGSLQGSDRPWRGAYHFISSGDPGPAQADLFLSVLNANGGLQPGDMPPAVDLEWDVAFTNGPDRWAGRGTNYILDTVLGCINRIKEKTGRTPVLYTAKSWFSAQTIPLADFDKLKGFPLWVADYRGDLVKKEEKPDFPGDTPQTLWQFTSTAQLTSGFQAGLDASIFNGTEADFKTAFNIA